MSTYLRLCKHLKNIKDLQANAIVQLQLISMAVEPLRQNQLLNLLKTTFLLF